MEADCPIERHSRIHCLSFETHAVRSCVRGFDFDLVQPRMQACHKKRKSFVRSFRLQRKEEWRDEVSGFPESQDGIVQVDSILHGRA